MLDDFMKALDLHQPDWWITFAHQEDLIEHARMCSDGHSGTIQAKNMVRKRTVERLFTPIRAAIACGLVEYKLPEPTVKEVLS